ncbi:antibiotic biosynthesis monooxygenase [Geodermatophilus ruber]|uniref:ABM domain-containing protein n=1 Tax=Geodermatophilus ruber TaxID=504800 RepID=A0A1I4GMN0_9ACTN|nr:antibiotic biosynthesis monooxygenase [Geodermatophilus ruber]SFL31312.1 hypothetical protein SAMN04488085_10988 [Geodermatophilus ruber]
MTTTTLPVTVAATRRAQPARADELQAWAATLCQTAARFPGHLRSDVRRRRTGDTAHVTVSLTFATATAASAWEASPERADLLARGELLTDGAPVTAALIPGTPPPPRWRTSLIVWAGLFPFALVLNAAAGPALAAMPLLPRTLLTTALLVPLAVYVGIPLVSRLLGSRAR